MKIIIAVVFVFGFTISFSSDKTDLYTKAYNLYISNPEECLKTLDAYEKQPLSESEQANSHYIRGLAYKELKNHSESFKSFTTSEEMYKRLENLTYQSNSLMQQAILYEEIHAYTYSISVYKDVIAIKKKNGEDFWLAEAYRNMANVYRIQQMYDSCAYFNIEMALPIYIKLNDLKGQSIIDLEIGIALYDMKDYEKSVESYFDALDLVKGTKHEVWMRPKTYNNAANALLELGEIDKALEYLYMSYGLKKGQFDNPSYIRTVYNIAKAHMRTGSYDSTVYYLQKLSDKQVDSEDMFLCYELADSLHHLNANLVSWNYRKGLNKYIKSLIEDKQVAENYYNFYKFMQTKNQIDAEKNQANDRIIIDWLGIGLYILLGVVAILLSIGCYKAYKKRRLLFKMKKE